MFDICFGQLQHVFSHWENIGSDVSSAWPPEDVPGIGIRIYSAQEPLQLAQYMWHFSRSAGNGTLLNCIRQGKSAED